jgi:group I intron endonuclease
MVILQDTPITKKERQQKMNYFIYKTTNNINGKYYIGQHITDNLEDGYLGSGTNLTRAIKKYGKENFSRDILATADNQEMLNELEAFYVTWDEVNDNNCYNLMTGGGACGKRGKETRKKMSEAKKGRISPMLGNTHSPETKQKMSQAHKGKNKGKTISPETRKKLSEGQKGKTYSLDSRKKMSEAKKGRKFTPEHRQKLSEAKKGKPRLFKGPFKGKTHSPETKQKMSEARKKYWENKQNLEQLWDLDEGVKQ